MKTRYGEPKKFYLSIFFPLSSKVTKCVYKFLSSINDFKFLYKSECHMDAPNTPVF